MLSDSLQFLPPVTKLLAFPVVPALLAEIAPLIVLVPLILPASGRSLALSVTGEKFMAQTGHRQGGINE